MSETKHTPGPWEAVGFINYHTKKDQPYKSGWKIKSNANPHIIATVDYDKENQEANARLIAAAPDFRESTDPFLLELAAKKLVELGGLSANGIILALRGKAEKERMAIVKAEGK